MSKSLVLSGPARGRLSWRGLMSMIALALCAVPVVQATTVLPPSFEEMVEGADCIVRARVTEVSSYEEPRGKKTVIRTRVTLDVIETIAGEPPTPLVLTLLGGRVGERELRVAGVPTFIVGQEEIFFVKDNGKAFYPTYAVMHGRYPVKRDKATGREYLTRSNGVPLTDTAEIATPMPEGAAAGLQRRARSANDALTPTAFTTKIRELRGNVREGARNEK